MSGADDLIETMDRLQKILRDPTQHLRRVVYPLRRKYYRQAFDTSGASTGRMWAPLEPGYSQIQRSAGDSLTPLETAHNPRLEPSFQGGGDHLLRIGGRSIEVGSLVPWSGHVARGGINPLTGESFVGRNPAIMSRSQIREMSQALMDSITKAIL